MDEILTRAWRSSAPPFDGETLSCSDYLPLAVLRTLMVQVANELKRRFGLRQLVQFDDWHQHDGFVSQIEPSGWVELGQILTSEESLYASRNPDDFVRKAFCDLETTFLLRFYVAEENDDPEQYPGIWGDFDLTGPTSLIKEVSAQLSGEGKSQLAVVGAKEFFDKVYSG